MRYGTTPWVSNRFQDRNFSTFQRQFIFVCIVEMGLKREAIGKLMSGSFTNDNLIGPVPSLDARQYSTPVKVLKHITK